MHCSMLHNYYKYLILIIIVSRWSRNWGLYPKILTMLTPFVNLRYVSHPHCCHGDKRACLYRQTGGVAV